MNSYFAASFKPQYSLESHYLPNGYSSSVNASCGLYSSRFSEQLGGYPTPSSGSYNGVMCVGGTSGHHNGFSSLSESCISQYNPYHSPKSSNLLHLSPHTRLSSGGDHRGHPESPKDSSQSSGYYITQDNSQNPAAPPTALFADKFSASLSKSSLSPGPSTSPYSSHHHHVHSGADTNSLPAASCNSNKINSGGGEDAGHLDLEKPLLLSSHSQLYQAFVPSNIHSQQTDSSHQLNQTPQQQVLTRSTTSTNYPTNHGNQHSSSNTTSSSSSSSSGGHRGKMDNNRRDCKSSPSHQHYSGYTSGHGPSQDWSGQTSAASTPSPIRTGHHSPFSSPSDSKAYNCCSLSPRSGKKDSTLFQELGQQQQSLNHSTSSTPEQPTPFYPWMGIVGKYIFESMVTP